MAALRWTGRNPGGVASSTTSTPLAITFWYASNPAKQVSGVTLILSLTLSGWLPRRPWRQPRHRRLESVAQRRQEDVLIRV